MKKTTCVRSEQFHTGCDLISYLRLLRYFYFEEFFHHQTKQEQLLFIQWDLCVKHCTYLQYENHFYFCFCSLFRVLFISDYMAELELWKTCWIICAVKLLTSVSALNFFKWWNCACCVVTRVHVWVYQWSNFYVFVNFTNNHCQCVKFLMLPFSRLLTTHTLGSQLVVC